MTNDVYKNAIELLPMFFDSQLQVDTHGAGIFEPLRKIIDFDEAFIFFLNPESISLKYVFSKNRKHSLGDTFNIDDEMKFDLFSDSSLVLGNANSLVGLLELTDNNSFLLSKLIIKNTVFGFILLCKKEKDFYKAADVNVMTTLSSVISYNIKDVELSEVCNTQLKALTTSVLQVKESEKIKTEFLANVSHELRTPLNSIIGFSEVLNNGFYGALNEKQSEFVHDINISGIHLMGMINEILDISKIEAKAMTLNRSKFSIMLAVDEVINVVKPLADEKSVQIVKNIDKDSEINVDFQKIKQILSNLLSNAIKFSPKKDEIGVKIYFKNNSEAQSKPELNRKSRVGFICPPTHRRHADAVLIAPQAALVIEVSDNGVGIAPENHQKIFEKFVQLQNAYTKNESSTGLGLTITKELAQMHGGKISVESDLGKGATFIVEIPLK